MELSLVNNDEKYYEFIRELRLHPDNIDGFINKKNITEDEQILYMRKYKECYKICLYGNQPVGFVGVIDNDIRVATKPSFKKMGIGKFMINEIIKEYPESFAKIKFNNKNSIKLFESCGFEVKYVIMKKCN